MEAGSQTMLRTLLRPPHLQASSKLPGTDPDLKDEAVIVTAHFDHLGYGQSGSMAPGTKAIHNGADDNASGAAALAILARRLPPLLPENHRSILFVAFNGEEVGLAGSSHYVEKPVMPLTETNLMLNLDMIGRMKDQGLVVLGTESGTVIEAWTREAGEAQKLNLQMQGDGYGPSDQTPFYALAEDWFRPVADLNFDASSFHRQGGTDHLSFQAVGVPAFAFIQDPVEYNLTHHSQSDTYDKAVAENLMQAATVMTTGLWNLANHDGDLPRFDAKLAAELGGRD